MSLWTHINAAICDATKQPFNIIAHQSIGGGCINRTFRAEGKDGRYFVKLNNPDAREMFAAEADALSMLQATKTIRVPSPICCGIADNTSYLAMEYLELGWNTETSEEVLGEQLAQLHRCTGRHYGWHRDNTIGSTPQVNTPANDWLSFWRDHRLGFQLQLAARQGYGGGLQRKGERLLNILDEVLAGHQPLPSLLHGDLWAGNHATLRDGRPVIFDPASYYGDRETDLAMTELFGGFSPRFYAAYREHYPLDQGYRLRKTLYNLYHVLNHLNLFGSGYGAQAEHMMDTLLSEAG